MKLFIFLVILSNFTICDYSMRFRLNSKIKQDSSTSIHFTNVDSTTFYDKIKLDLSTKIVKSNFKEIVC